MAQTVFGPVNIKQGYSAEFVAEFLDSNGNVTTPSSAYITVDYTNTSNAAQSDDVSMTTVGSFWTGTWSSTSASLGLANWSLYGYGSTEVAQSGIIRVIST